MKRRTIITQNTTSLEACVATEVGERAREFIERGAVYVDGRRVKTHDAVLPVGATITIVIEESGQAERAVVSEAPALEILQASKKWVAVNKPAGVVAQPTPGGTEVSLLEQVSTYLGEPAGLVHRLDRETSGVTVFGKNADATRWLSGLFRDGLVTKRYLAVVPHGIEERGVIDAELAKDSSRPGRWKTTNRGNGVTAQTEFLRLWTSADKGFALVELWPRTGRTHQLRVHLKSIGFPIVGDELYGGAAGPRCLLHARTLVFEQSVIDARLPADMQRFFDDAGVRVPAGRRP